mgnify:CR=1 FL=1
MNTFTGRIFDPLKMTKKDVCVEDIVHALETGARYAAYEHGEANYDYAIENMNIKKTGREYAQVYKDAINGR